MTISTSAFDRSKHDPYAARFLELTPGWTGKWLEKGLLACILLSLSLLASACGLRGGQHPTFPYNPSLTFVSTSVSIHTTTHTVTPAPSGTPTATATAAVTPAPTRTPPPTRTLISTRTTTPTRLPTSTPTQTSAPLTTVTQVSPLDGMVMVFVPAGEFWMGLAASKRYINQDAPLHKVFLDAFWIDRTEVTNGMYARCVQAGVCQSPRSYDSNARHGYYGGALFDNYPVIFVSWFDATAYCEWAGRRLPSEAQWEKAARGALDISTFPWGEGDPNCNLANFYPGRFCAGDTSEAGSYPLGVSPNGALDMAGNVIEWAADWYEAGYYSISPASNPAGPQSGSGRVLRGGGWRSMGVELRLGYRLNGVPTFSSDDIGFRCARSGE